MATASLVLGPPRGSHVSTSSRTSVRSATCGCTASIHGRALSLRQPGGRKHARRARVTAAAGGGPFGSDFDRAFADMDRQFAEFDRQFAEMDRQMDRDMSAIFGRADSLSAQQRARLQERMAEQQRQQQQQEQRSAGEPQVAIERFEDRGNGRYTYYESIQISSSGGARLSVSTLPTGAAPAGASPWLLVAAIVAGAYAAVATAFARAYDRTTYKETGAYKWALVFGWPLLALWSKRFRAQLSAVLQGKRASVTRPPGQELPSDKPEQDER